VILAISLNPAYDVTYAVPRLQEGRVHRVASVHRRVGGKAINVARVLGALGEDAEVLALADGELVERGRAEGVAVHGVPAFAHLRQTLVVQADSGSTTSLWEDGPAPRRGAVERLIERAAALVTGAAAVVVSGSLPPGASADIPARLARLATAHNLPVVVDVDDEALRLAAAVDGAVLMPNEDELERLVGHHLSDHSAVASACRDLLDLGPSAVVATRGADGLLAVSAAGAWHAVLDEPLAGNPTGAGDAAAAAVVRRLTAATTRWEDLVREACATSASALLAPVAGEICASTRDELEARVRVTRIW
jgi:tagatose 6-phosphate kinase